MKIFPTVENQPQTGSAKLHRYHLFGDADEDMDVPDGDLEFGRMYYKDNCSGCHNMSGDGPSLISVYGGRGGRQKFSRYSSRGRHSHPWTKQRLFLMMENPEQYFGLQSAMLVDPIPDPYIRASIIEYLKYVRMTDPQAIKPKFYVVN